MQLGDYFDFLTPEDIRIRGHRIGIETVLYEYIHRRQTPEQIAAQFPTLTVEEVYATILYYLHNRAAVTAYLTAWLEHGEQARAAQAQDPAVMASRQRLRHARANQPAQEEPSAVGTNRA
jgi:uncharacterized protein (DUF433 family)